MKTTIKPDFSELGNEVLSGKLQQLIHEFPLSYIFYHPNAKDLARIVLITNESADVEMIGSRKWIRNSRDENGILFYIASQKKMDEEYRSGNPFIAWYCQQSAVIYQNPQAKGCHDTDWPSFKKRFKKYSWACHHDRDSLLSAVNRFQQLGSFTGVFISYLAVFEYDIRLLEILYSGRSLEPCNLHHRIKQLNWYIPEIERIFVPKNGNEYYLISELEKANDVANDGDEIRLNDKLIESIGRAEENLHEIVLSRLSGLKSLIKSGFLKQPEPGQSGFHTVDDELVKVITQLLRIHPVEEIYLFHRNQTNQRTTFFLLLIGEGLGTEILDRIHQSVKAKFEEKLMVVLIGHSRSWIQQNLFYQQSFFIKVMQPVNLLYQSGQNHPSVHWENPNESIYPDLEYYYNSAIKLAAQYFVLRNHSEKDNAEGMHDLFSKSILRIFRTLVYAKLGYLPNYLPAFTLWKLCIYADPGLEKLEYLFEKLSGMDFFKEINYHVRFDHDLSRLTEKKLLVADEILNELLAELNTAFNHVKETSEEVD